MVSQEALENRDVKNTSYNLFHNIYLKWPQRRRQPNNGFCQFIILIYKIAISGPSLRSTL